MAADENCVFCKIVSGEVPSLAVWRGQSAYCFLDINPLSEGHILLVPTEHYGRLQEMPATAVAEVCSALPQLGAALRAATNAPGFNVLLNDGKPAGQVVGHVHFHLIPRMEGDGLGYRWRTGQYSAGRDKELQSALRDALGE